MEFGQAGSYTNDGTISDGADITASGVTLTNSGTGLIVGGVRFLQGGSTVINSAGGTVSVANGLSPYTNAAVTGSSGADSFTNNGSVSGLIQLGDGNDVFGKGATSTSYDQVTLGAGDDSYVRTGTGGWVSIDGGDGYDRVELTVTNQAQSYGSGGTNVTGFEELVLNGAGQFNGYSGFTSIILGTPEQYGHVLIDSANPLVDLALAGNEMRLSRSTLRSVTGSDVAERLTLDGNAAVSGAIDLAGGNDTLSLSRNGGGIPAFGGSTQGGAGFDTLSLSSTLTASTMTYDLAEVAGFERLYLNVGSVRQVDYNISNADGFTRMQVGTDASVTLHSSNSPAAYLWGAFGATVLLDAETTLGHYAPAPGDGFVTDTGLQTADSALSVHLTNLGDIVGNVAFYTGDDTYDGSAGSVGGTVFGNAGDDTLIGSAADDRFEGGYGDDRLQGGAGDDTLIGGDGIDTAVFTGNSEDYSWTIEARNSEILGADGADSLSGIERLEFDNASFRFGATGAFEGPALLTATFGASAAAGGWSNNDTYPRLLADANGDGQLDLVGFGSGGVYVAPGTGNGQFGTASLVLAGFGAGAAAGGWTDSRAYPRTLADISGDGRADIVGFGSSGVYLSNGMANGQFVQPTLALAGFGASAAAGGWSDDNVYTRRVADVNGDGQGDIVGFGDGGVFVALGGAQWAGGGAWFGPVYQASTGFGASAAAGGWNDNDVYTRTLADVNGDGLADIVGFGSGGVHIALAQENGMFGTAFLGFAGFGAEASAGGWTSNTLYYRTTGDVDADGHIDLVGFGDGGVHVAYGDGTGQFATAELLLAGFGAGASAGGWTSQDLYPRMLADLDSDGAADIVGFGDGGVIAATSIMDWLLVS